MGGDANRLPTSICNSVRFNWPHVTGESRQFINTVGNPPSQYRSLGTHTLLRVQCGSLETLDTLLRGQFCHTDPRIFNSCFHTLRKGQEAPMGG